MTHQAGTPLDLVDTEYSACSVATQPYGDRSLIATGLYQIVKDDSADGAQDASAPATKRLGRCLLSRIDGKGKLREVQRIETAAILDMAWSNETNSSTLAIADSVGQISLYDYTEEEEDGRDGQLVQRQTVQIADPSLLVLSLDWDNRRSRSSGSIVASISDGTIAVLRGEAQLKVEQTWHAHDYEPWIAAWDYWNPRSVWTGGDDCKLKLWDLRTGTTFPSAVKKDFSAGVTTIQSHPLAENIFAVGSYDATLRLFDRRNIKQPLVEHNAGGGIWRVRWHPTNPDKLLLACMHDGFKIITAEDGFSRCVTTTRFDEHGKDALAYGVDWCGSAGSKGVGEGSARPPAGETVASCSFYDHQLRTWSAAM